MHVCDVYICHDSVEAAVDFISTTLTETDKKLEELLARSGSDSEASAHNAGDPGSIPGWKDPLEKEMATHSSTLA